MRATVLLALVALASLGALASARNSNLHEWAQYKRQHGKVYADRAEDARRFSLFLAAKERVERHNANESHSYKLGLNHLSDLSPDELAGPMKREITRHRSARNTPDDLSATDPSQIPKAVDWRTVPNRVSPVRNQCSSDLTSGHFAVAGLLEGQQVVRNFTKEVVPLSVQELVDCAYGGGDNFFILQDLAYVGGVMAERDYKFVDPAPSWCHFEASKSVMSVKGSKYLNIYASIEEKLASYGPLATFMQIVPDMLNYKSGVFVNDNCKTGHVHYMLIVGYGTDPDHGDYWILKNSWGPEWGEDGYMRIQRGKNTCSVEDFICYALF